MNSQANFFEQFQMKNFSDAQQIFDELSSADKQAVFEKLFQYSQFQKTPNSVSVLFRKLHDGKQFEGFRKAWFPPEVQCNPTEAGGETFQQFFDAPIRVINAVNIQDPSDVVSIGLHWFPDEDLMAAMQDPNFQQRGQARGERIAKVADKVQAEVYFVKSDDNLGTPF